ncbi:hypothetical protein PTTG_03167 [Puccinia triticina 1-1 BBBD Race 1]|uniref:Tyrosine specific protein phosphatases domain-containing protein n=1 Tax=Puccinia triticina (isolate 1-1 / race 1 (BBBD)) TaxID=630390 RepID=A0A180G0R6_PUCT1|nr:hypothetical protein PTTG_03167 [Puccinia triticina 1-1 BBBD Race 1]
MHRMRWGSPMWSQWASPRWSPHTTSTNRTAALGRRLQPTPRVVNLLWHEWKSGPMEMLDMKGVADDGMDLIRPHIERAMAFIKACRVAGGKVLVHCLVGVSRSASIVIAHVMKHCWLDLTSAYLMVRSRRLNILIQPNHLFMWSIKRLETTWLPPPLPMLVPTGPLIPD